MDILKNISLRWLLMIPCGLLALLLIAALIWDTINVYVPKYRSTEHLAVAYQMADKLLLATTAQAKERGFTASRLSGLKRGEEDSGLTELIRSQRQIGDSALEEGLAKAQALAGGAFSTPAITKLIDEISQVRAEVQALREQVDAAEGGGDVPKEALWLETITGLVFAASDLRLAAFIPRDSSSIVE